MKSIVLLVFAAMAVLAQHDHDHDGHLPGELHFNSAGIAVRLVDPDSILITVGARSEDLQNTVWVFPYGDEDTATFRLFEHRIEEYFQDRIPVLVDGRRLFFRVVQWKPGGQGRDDRLDMESLYVDNLFITLGARLPAQRTRLTITTNMWLERRDAGETVVQYSFFHGTDPLRRLWTHRERRVTLPLAADSIAAMRANPPPPLIRQFPEEMGDPGDFYEDDHHGHGH